MFLVSDARKTRFAAKEAFIVRTQGSCKAKLGGSRNELYTRVSFPLGSQLVCFCQFIVLLGITSLLLPVLFQLVISRIFV
jgi:hypothetical protein